MGIEAGPLWLGLPATTCGLFSLGWALCRIHRSNEVNVSAKLKDRGQTERVYFT